MKNKMLLPVTGTLLLSACAVTHVDPLTVPLNYTTDNRNAAQVGSLACSSVGSVQVSDARTDKTLGTRLLENKPLTAKVTTNSDVSQYVQSGVQAVMAQNGLTLGRGPTLSLALNSLNTTETVWHRAGYDAHIALAAKLTSASGKVCWNETIQGRGGNYGYSGSIQNYQQTVDEALANATLSMLQAQAFKDALCQCAN